MSIFLPCPNETGFNPQQIGDKTFLTFLCDDECPSAYVNTLPTLFFDCLQGGEPIYTILDDGVKHIFNGNFSYQLSCNNDLCGGCGVAGGLPETVDWDCADIPGLPDDVQIDCSNINDLPPFVVWECGAVNSLPVEVQFLNS